MEKNIQIRRKRVESWMKKKVSRNIYLTSFKDNKIYTKEFSISTKHFELQYELGWRLSAKETVNVSEECGRWLAFSGGHKLSVEIQDASKKM